MQGCVTKHLRRYVQLLSFKILLHKNLSFNEDKPGKMAIKTNTSQEHYKLFKYYKYYTSKTEQASRVECK